jgi:hypothetical protein
MILEDLLEEILGEYLKVILFFNVVGKKQKIALRKLLMICE